MHIKKTSFYILILVICTSILLIAAIYYLYSRDDNLRCPSTYHKDKQCGEIIKSSIGSYFINGLVKSKRNENGNFIIEFKTLNNNKHITTIPITLPYQGIPFGVTQRSFNLMDNDSKINLTQKELYDSLAVNDEVRLSFYIATKDEINTAKKTLDTNADKFLECNISNKILLDRVKNASFFTPVINLIDSFTNKCPIYIAEWQIFQK